MHCVAYNGYMKVEVLVAQSCLTFCDSMDCSSPGYSVHGILQARTLPWLAISCSREFSWSRDWTQVSALQADSLPSELSGVAQCIYNTHIWPWNMEWSRAKTNRVLPRERTGHRKHLLPTTQEKTLHMDITRWSTPKSDWLYSWQPKMEKLYTDRKSVV